MLEGQRSVVLAECDSTPAVAVTDTPAQKGGKTGNTAVPDLWIVRSPTGKYHPPFLGDSRSHQINNHHRSSYQIKTNILKSPGMTLRQKAGERNPLQSSACEVRKVKPAMVKSEEAGLRVSSSLCMPTLTSCFRSLIPKLSNV